MSYEKTARELPFLGFMFEMPIVVAGVGVGGVGNDYIMKFN